MLKEEKPILKPARGSLDEVIYMDRIPKRDGFRENNGCVHPYAFPMQEAVRLVDYEKKLEEEPPKQKNSNVSYKTIVLVTDQSGYSE